jgi:hypothetical protein
MLKTSPPHHYVSDPLPLDVDVPRGALLIDLSKLTHAPSVFVPLWYQDQRFKCRDCGMVEVWTAAQQKHFCETQKGDPSAVAIRCHACRQKQNVEKRERRELQDKAQSAKKTAARAKA